MKKKAKRKEGLLREYSSGLYTEAGMRSFAMSALRRARWGPKVDVIKRAKVGPGINPATGHKCILHKCEKCGELFPKSGMRADHVNPIIPIEHDWADDPNSWLGYNWTQVMKNLWIEVGDGWAVLCEECHRKKSAEEKKERLAVKARKAQL
jgi:5-methylcytosine-specific restriction endonuclease McrA